MLSPLVSKKKQVPRRSGGLVLFAACDRAEAAADLAAGDKDELRRTEEAFDETCLEVTSGFLEGICLEVFRSNCRVKIV